MEIGISDMQKNSRWGHNWPEITFFSTNCCAHNNLQMKTSVSGEKVK